MSTTWDLALFFNKNQKELTTRVAYTGARMMFYVGA